MDRPFIHILGTDTDVGKTYVTHQLLHILSKKKRVLPIKPIHSGWGKNELLGEDLACHQPFIKGLNKNDLCCYSFEKACSPHYASSLENEIISITKLNSFMNQTQNLPCDFALVEGIGGVCCPLAPDLTYLDFLKANRAPILLVGKVGLGALNQMIMTCKILENENLNILGIVLNMEHDYAKDDFIVHSAKWELEQQLKHPIWGPLPYSNEKETRKILSKIKVL